MVDPAVPSDVPYFCTLWAIACGLWAIVAVAFRLRVWQDQAVGMFLGASAALGLAYWLKDL